MHQLSNQFQIFSNNLSPLDLQQGGVGDCYLIAVFAALANRNNGDVLRNMFVDEVKFSLLIINFLYLSVLRVIIRIMYTPLDG